MISVDTALIYGSLTGAIASLWLPARVRSFDLWRVLFVLALVSGLMGSVVQPIALPWIALWITACYTFGQRAIRAKAVQALLGVLIVLLAIGLIAHRVPGFSYPPAIAEAVLSPGAGAYTQYWRFDKALVGLFLLAFCHPLLTTDRVWMPMLRLTIPAALALSAILTALGLSTGYSRFDPKLPVQFFIWVWINLFFTCIAEEALFRGFLQRQLQSMLASRVRQGNLIALLLVSVLFGLAHYEGGWLYVALATVAGFGYGWVYQRTRRIESSILTHCAVNTVHFVGFTYPALQPA